jgi:uncharacterized protein (TIGR00296 family)
MELPLELCYLCFETLINHLTTSQDTRIWDRIATLFKNPPWKYQPVIIAWRKDGESRGCMGGFNPGPTVEGVRQHAKFAAFHDGRLPPITLREVTSLQVVVSVLHSFEPAADAYDWTVGVHGLRLIIDHGVATYLPGVAVANKWKKEELLVRLARRAGYRGEFNVEAVCRMSVERFQVSERTAKWEEYQRYLRWLA